MSGDEIEIDLSNFRFQTIGEAMTINPQWSVFPVEAGGKRPWPGCMWKAESRPRAEWGEAWPEGANVGIDCGKSGLIVLDEDVPGAVEEWLGAEPNTYTVTTGKGRHFYFYALGQQVKNRVRVAPGVDVRSAGGYVVGAGSVHESGNRYAVLRDVPLKPLPRLPQDEETGDPDVLEIDLSGQPFDLPESIPDGERDDTLYKYACSLAARGVHTNEGLALLRLAFDGCKPPYRERTPEEVWARVTRDYGPQVTFDRSVEREVERIKVREAASERVRSEKAGAMVLPSLVSLGEFLDTPDLDAAYMIEGVWPEDANVLLAAKEKTGKSTLTGNLIRSLVDGDPFLGQHKVTRKRDRVVLLDFELSENMMRRWLRDQSIQNVGAVNLLSMRGQAMLFDILNPATLEKWAKMIGPADVLFVDCLRPVVDALGMNEDKDGSKVTQALSTLCAQAGIGSWNLIHHMGHGGNERARGDSGLVGTADVLWRLLREDPEKPMPQPVYFTAFGRDVDQPEERLVFDPYTRRLTAIGGTRAEAKGDREVEVMMKALRTVTDPLPPWNRTTIGGLAKGALGCGDKAALKVVDHAVKDGLLQHQKGKNNADLYCITVDGGALG